MKSNIKINENKYFFWFNYPEISRSKENLNEYIKDGRLFEMKSVFHLPFNIIYKDRMYYIIQYSDSCEYEITARILKVYDKYNSIIGRNSLRIENISNVRNILKFIRDFDIQKNIIALEFSSNYKGKELKGIIKNISSKIDNIEFLVDDGQGPKVISISEINERTPIFGELVQEFLKNLMDNLSFFLYFDFKCTNGGCIINILMEEKMFPVMVSGLNNLNTEIFNIRLSKYEALQ